MAHQSPLNRLHEQAEASFLMYGPAADGVPVVETFGELEAEYAAIRRGCVLIDLPQRATLRIAGADRLEFLNRMVTQELKGLAPFHMHRSFWLNRKGRIDADMRLIQMAEETWIDLDILSAPRAVESLTAFIFTEDALIEDATERKHRLALHGPRASALLRAVSNPVDGPPLSDLSPGQATLIEIAGTRILADRQDPTGDHGIELLLDTTDVPAVYEQLLERGLNGDDPAGPDGGYRLRTAGWHAYNIARIEAGWPLFNIDFGTESLPHETGVLKDRVSFTKGCYLGQEVVARMESRGHSKQNLIALRIGALGREAPEWQPKGGAPVLTGDGGETVGAVTSSTRSPMLGDDIICFAQVRNIHAAPGTKLTVRTEAGDAPTEVQPSLVFWSR